MPGGGKPCTVPYLPGEEDVVAEQLDFGWVYEITPLATFRMVTRLEHLTEEAQHLEHQQHSILELREREGLFRYVAQRQLDVDSGPRARLFSSRPMLKQTHVWQPPNWDGSRRFDATAEISGMSLNIAGDGAITPTGTGGTRLHLSLVIEARGRLAGRKTEAGIAESLAQTIEAEHAFRLIWLDRQGRAGF
jgi:hypothetical protein